MIHNACLLGVDLVVISEQFRILPEWIGDSTGDAAIWVTGFKGRFASLTPPIAAEGIATAIVDNTVMVSCYCPPSKKGPAFLQYLEELEGVVLSLLAPGRGVILAGDLNSIRVRDRCTFRTGRGSSFIDVLSVDRSLAGRVRKSEVLRHYTASDHLYVRHTLAKPGVVRRPPGDGWTPYVMRDVTPESILEGFRVLWNALPTPPTSLATPAGVSAPPPPLEPSGFTDEVPRAEGLQRLLEGVSARVLRKRCLPRGTRKPNRWWNADIAEARPAMHRARRLLQTSRRRLDPSSPRLEQLRRDFSLARRTVQVLIWRPKERL